MKSLTMALATVPFLLSSCMVVDLQWQQGNGLEATEIRALPSFDRVRLDCPVHVIVKAGPAYEAYITSDANLTEYFQTDTYGGTLTIGMASGIQPSVEPEITVVVPRLSGVVHNGNGLVEIEEDGDFPDMSLTLNGGGEIRFSGTASRLKAVLNGSGAIVMEGYAALLSADLSGDGEIHGENLLSGDADVSLSGSGLVFLDLDYQSELNLDLTGSGRVEWWGAPSRLNYNLTGTGKVIEHRGLPKKSAAAKATAGAKAAAKGAVGPAYESVPALPKKVIRFSEAQAKK